MQNAKHFFYSILKKDLITLQAAFGGDEQQDAGEFFTLFINYMTEKFDNITRPLSSEYEHNYSQTFNPVKRRMFFRIIEDAFCIFCRSCKSISIDHMDLHIPLPAESGEQIYHLKNLIADYLFPSLQRSQLCENGLCNQNTDHQTKLVIDVFPALLVIHLKRYYYDENLKITLKNKNEVLLEDFLYLPNKR